jgi:hypothetical protein
VIFFYFIFYFFRLYLSQLLCGACEKQTQFKVSAWDLDVPDEPADEHFTARQPMFQVYIGERLTHSRERTHSIERTHSTDRTHSVEPVDENLTARQTRSKSGELEKI